MIIITLRTNEKSRDNEVQTVFVPVSATILVCGFDNNVNDSLDEIKVIQVGIKEADLGWTAWVGALSLPH